MKGIEKVAESRLRQPRPRILYGHEHVAERLFASGDQQVAWTVTGAIHRLNRIDNQVQYDLLQLDPITQHDREAVHQVKPHRYTAFCRLAPGQFYNFADGSVQIYKIPSCRRLPGESADPLYDLTGSVAVPYDAVERLRRLLYVGCRSAQPPKGGTGIGNSPG